MMNKSCAIGVRNLDVRRGGHQVFAGLELDVPAGKITGLLGPSGCGKTTLMRAIVGAQRIGGGEISVLGRPAGDRTLRTRVSYATQSAAVYDDLTVMQNLRYFARMLDTDRSEPERVLDATDLRSRANVRVSELSGGQRGRVSLGVAMLGSPELLILDEPTVGLDPVLRDSLWTLFRGLADAGATLLISSHVMDEAMRCDEVVLMRSGHLVAQLPPQRLLDDTGTTNPEDAFLALVERDGHTRRELREGS